MFVSLILRLLGHRPIWEVRLVSTLTKKDLPGTRVHSGFSYRQARKAFAAAVAKSKPNCSIKLQAVLIADTHLSENVHVEAKAHKQARDDRMDSLKMAAAHRLETNQYLDLEPAPGPEPEPDDGKTDPAAIGHTCNFAGEMRLVDGAYRATCSVCSEVQ